MGRDARNNQNSPEGKPPSIEWTPAVDSLGVRLAVGDYILMREGEGFHPIFEVKGYKPDLSPQAPPGAGIITIIAIGQIPILPGARIMGFRVSPTRETPQEQQEAETTPASRVVLTGDFDGRKPEPS